MLSMSKIFVHVIGIDASTLNGLNLQENKSQSTNTTAEYTHQHKITSKQQIHYLPAWHGCKLTLHHIYTTRPA
jgi:response regulator of citrate/malate metabolism